MNKPVDKLRSAVPAEGNKPILSRAQLEMIEEDPTKLETVARLMGAVNLDNLFRFMQQPDVNGQTRLEFQKLLNRMGRLEPEKDEGRLHRRFGVVSWPTFYTRVRRGWDVEEALGTEKLADGDKRD